jgi:hypothetical protein
VYGTGTRSYNRSTEAREMKRQQREATERYRAGELKIGNTKILVCTCRSFRFAHDPAKHSELLSDMDWRTPEERANYEVWEDRIY